MSFIPLIQGKVIDVKDKTAKGYDIQEVTLNTDARIIVLFNQKAVKVGGKFKATNLFVKEFRGSEQLNMTRKSILEFDSTPSSVKGDHVHLYICSICGDKATFPQ